MNFDGFEELCCCIFPKNLQEFGVGVCLGWIRD